MARSWRRQQVMLDVIREQLYILERDTIPAPLGVMRELRRRERTLTAVVLWREPRWRSRLSRCRLYARTLAPPGGRPGG